jgi:hypothetical protein
MTTETKTKHTQIEGIGRAKPKEVSFSAVAIRCRCGDPWRLHPCRCSNPGNHTGQPCPKGNEPCPQGIEEDFGTVSYWHRNPLKRLWFWFQKILLGKKVQV